MQQIGHEPVWLPLTLGQQFNVGEKPTVILYTCIVRHAGTSTKQNEDKRHDGPGLYNPICNIGSGIGWVSMKDVYYPWG